MEINKSILSKYLEQAAIEQLTKEFESKGYEVIREHHKDKYRFDLMVRNKNETIIFEIKAGKWDSEKMQQIKHLRNYAVHELGAKFKLVLVNLPEEPEIFIDNIEEVFYELLPEEFVDEFSDMATHFLVDEISDISFDVLHFQENHLELKGAGVVTCEFQYGSNMDYKHDNGLLWLESFEFQFHLILDASLKIKEIISLELVRDNDEFDDE